MEIRIIEDKENPLLNRREVKFELKFQGPTPPRKDVKEAVRSKLGVDPALVVIRKLNQPFGASIVDGEASIYKDEKSKSVEHAHFARRDAGEKGTGKTKVKKASPPRKK